MKKNLFGVAAALTLGLGALSACSSNDVPTPPNGGGTAQSTSMTVVFQMGQATRATDYNSVGTFAGQDKLENYKVYVFDGDQNDSKLEIVQNLASGEVTQETIGGNIVFRPTKAIKVKPGVKTVFVVVNNNAKTDAVLPSNIGVTTKQQFNTAYNSSNLAIEGAGMYTEAQLNSNTATVKTSASEIAKLVEVNEGGTAVKKDVILMTGPAVAQNINDNVTETTATDYNSVSSDKDDAKNQVVVTVKRAVAKVLTTSTAASYEIKGDDPYTSAADETVLGTISNLTYTTVQSERKVYFSQQEAAEKTAQTSAKWNSPAIDTEVTDQYSVAGSDKANEIAKKYDYTNLWKGYQANVDNQLLGTTVVASNLYQNGTPTAETIGKLMEGDYVLPTTHTWGADADATKYRKGNSAYVLVRGLFKPTKINVGYPEATTEYKNPAFVDAATTPGVAEKLTFTSTEKVPNSATRGRDGATPSKPKAAVDFTSLTEDQLPETIVKGTNNKFYTSVYASQDPAFNGVVGQAVEVFTKVKVGATVGYKMVYVAWVNPDQTATGLWYNDPVYRNNIYHIEVEGFKGLGSAYNNLVPPVPVPPGVDPNTPFDPQNPNTPHDPNDPNSPNNPNPDPKNPPVSVLVPNDPTDPTIPTDPNNEPTPTIPTDTPPVNVPTDELTPKATYMSVSTKVLPWQVHSYKVKL